jgi:phosphohistidine phosphatase
MKTVIFFRHGKSDWTAHSESDHERPLAERGKKAAQLMGVFLARAEEIPDSAVTSSARRAVKTFQRAARSGNWRCASRITDRLYECTPSDILEEIRQESDATGILLIVGHEPVLSESISLLAGRVQLRFPTAAMARVDFPVARWSQVDCGQGRLMWLLTPSLIQKLQLLSQC